MQHATSAVHANTADASSSRFSYISLKIQPVFEIQITTTGRSRLSCLHHHATSWTESSQQTDSWQSAPPMPLLGLAAPDLDRAGTVWCFVGNGGMDPI